ncbi:MAG: hypothetical protein ACU0CI_05475 [Shimia sp.]
MEAVQDWFSRNSAAMGGLAVGAFAGVIVLLLGSVLYTGEGYGEEPEPPEQVYIF